MKKFITLNPVFLALLFGCNPDTNVTSPDDSLNSPAKLISCQLAMKSGLVIESELTRYKDISGAKGGTFSESFEFQSVNGPILINSQLDFPANSFTGNKTISQTFDTETTSLEFGPAMQFSAAVKYTLTVFGLDLTGINPATLDFVYVAQNGTLTGVVHEGITINFATGTLKITNAKLNHFSRYGFVN